MRKIYCFLCFCLPVLTCLAQQPYIATAGGDGLGQYGYLEKDAVTFSRLERNTYNNIAYLSARWWITDNNNSNGDGKEYIYHVYNGPDWINGVGWQCGGDNYPSKRTTDYMAADFIPEWTAGSDCYVSVCAKYCDESYSPASFDGTTTNGAAGFNERHFRVVDVDTSLHSSTATYIANSNGNCQTNNSFNVAGSFSIDPGAVSGSSLTTLILQNTGTAMEAVDIPNTSLNVYYEPAAAGAEIYGDGNEIFAGALAGDWDGNTSDHIFGSTTLNIPLNGKIRVYVLLCAYNSPGAVGKLVNLRIINDGIFLSPALDGFTKVRMNAGSISQRNIVLPVKFIQFNGNRSSELVQLKWVISSAAEAGRFLIQQSFDGIDFTNAGTKMAADFSQQMGNYQFVTNTKAEYFRIAILDGGGIQNFSNIIRLKFNPRGSIKLLQNPVEDEVILQSSLTSPTHFNIRVSDIMGKLLSGEDVVIKNGLNKIPIPPHAKSQFLLVHLQGSDGTMYNFKIIRQ